MKEYLKKLNHKVLPHYCLSLLMHDDILLFSRESIITNYNKSKILRALDYEDFCDE